MELNKMINRYCSFLLASSPPRDIMQSSRIDLDSISQQVDGNLFRKNPPDSYKFFKSKNSKQPTDIDVQAVSSYQQVIGTFKKGVSTVSSFFQGAKKVPLSTQNQPKPSNASAQSSQPFQSRQQLGRSNNTLITRCEKCSCANRLRGQCTYCQGNPDIEIIQYGSDSNDTELDARGMTSAQLPANLSCGISPLTFYTNTSTPTTKENNSSRNSSRLNASILNSCGLSASDLSNSSESSASEGRKYEVDYLFVGTHRFLSRTFIRITNQCLILNIASYKESINIDFKLIKCLRHCVGRSDSSSKHTYLKIDFLEEAVNAINDYIGRRPESEQIGSFRFEGSDTINGHEKYFVMKLKFMQPFEAQELREKLRIYLCNRFKEDSAVLKYFEEQREYCLHQRSTRTKRQKTSDSKIKEGLQNALPVRESRSEAMEVDTYSAAFRNLSRTTGYNTRSMATYERASSGMSVKRPFGSSNSVRLLDDDMEISEVTESDLSFKNIKNRKIVFETTMGETLVILKSDLHCLSDGNFLNDKIIEFYLIYIRSKLIDPAIAEKTYIFSSFFFTKMLSLTKGALSEEDFNENLYNLVKNWTKNVDIFNFDYLIVPIFKSSHWSLAIIVHPGKLLQDDFEIVLDDSEHKPCIIFMDSMGKSRTVFNRYAKLLRNFLRKECANRKNLHFEFTANDIGMFDPEVPFQLNGYDCGIFILHYVELFLKNPLPIITRIQNTKKLNDWFSSNDLRGKRKEIFNILQGIHDENVSNNLKFESDEDATLKSDEEIEILTSDKSDRSLNEKSGKSKSALNDNEIRDLLSDDDDTMA